MVTTLIHGNDMTHAITMFRGGRKLVLETVFTNNGPFSRPVVALLLPEDSLKSHGRPWPYSGNWEKDWEGHEILSTFAVDGIVAPTVAQFLPAQIGDELRHLDGGLPAGHRWQHIVTQEDLDRGYAVYSTYMGVRSGRLEMPVFLRPRSYYQRGDAGRPSESDIV